MENPLQFLQPGEIDIAGLVELDLLELAPEWRGEELKDAAIREGAEKHKDYLRARSLAEEEFKREREEAELSGALTADAESYYELAIKSQVRESTDFTPTKKVPIIQGLLERGTVNWVAAGSGTFKSFVTADLAFRYGSEDMDYYGRKMTHGRALIVLAEGASGYAHRQRAWEREHDKQVKGVAFLPHAVQLGRPHEVAALIHYLKQEEEAGRGYGLVVIDTQAMSTVGVDENTSEMNTVISQLGRIRDACNSCVVVVHHFGKDKRSGMRGSSMLYAAADTIIVTKRAKDGGMVVELSTSPEDGGKQKDLQSESDFLVLEMRSHQVDTDYFDDPITSLVPVPADTASSTVQGEPDGVPLELPSVTDKQMIYLKALSYFETDGASPSGVAVLMNEQAGQKIAYQQLVRNAFIGLKKIGLVDQPVSKGPWVITPLGTSVILREMSDRVRLEGTWVDRAPSRRRKKHPVDQDQTDVSELVSDPSAKPPAETSETSGNL